MPLFYIYNKQANSKSILSIARNTYLLLKVLSIKFLADFVMFQSVRHLLLPWRHVIFTSCHLYFLDVDECRTPIEYFLTSNNFFPDQLLPTLIVLANHHNNADKIGFLHGCHLPFNFSYAQSTFLNSKHICCTQHIYSTQLEQPKFHNPQHGKKIETDCIQQTQRKELIWIDNKNNLTNLFQQMQHMQPYFTTETGWNFIHTMYNGGNAKLRIFSIALKRQCIQSDFMTDTIRNVIHTNRNGGKLRLRILSLIPQRQRK